MGVTTAGGGSRVGRRYLVSGRVQGVFFRASARREAQRLGVTGSARNLADGRVEVLAFGAPEPLRALCAWLHQGPPAARVDTVRCEAIAYQVHDGFHVR